MDLNNFKALVVRETSEKQYVMAIEEKQIEDLPEGDLLVRVTYSSLNYKDALSASGNRGVTRRYPHTPGIDAVGVVVQSRSDRFVQGDEVVVSCYKLGMSVAGGFGQFIRVPEKWVMNLPSGLSQKEAMIIGTGGFTAAHSVYRLRQAGVMPENGKVLVTGATGGVGSFAVQILAKLGYRVMAVSGKESARQFLLDLGAEDVLGRSAVQDQSGRAVLKGRWAGVVDTVGGEILGTAIKSVCYGGAVTCCGNVAGPDFAANVYPFILRGVSLLGIDSAECPMPLREEIWQMLAGEWKSENLASLGTEISLENLPDYIQKMLAGQVQGRVVVNLW